jgi:hypothetical protein
MDELSMFTDLRPPHDPVDVTGARTRLTAAIAGKPGRPTHRTRWLVTAAVATSAAAAAIVVPTVLPRSGGSEVTHAAWTVDLKSDGTVTLTIQQVFANLDGLQQTLRSDGVPATVALVPWKISGSHGGVQAIQACGYGRYISRDSEPAAVQRAVITHPVVKAIDAYAGRDYSIVKVATTSPDPSTWIIHPGEMPRGSVLFIVASPTVNNEGIGGSVSGPVVLRGDHAPVCVPGDDVASQWQSR